MSNKTKWFLVVVALGFSVGIISVYFISRADDNKKGENVVVTNEVKKASPEPIVQDTKKDKVVEEAVVLPDRIVLDVPFYSQAPFAVWDDLHKETCEEASLHMVRDYFRKKVQDLNEQDESLIDYVNWQTSKGYKFDITLQELADASELYYKFAGYKIIKNPTIDDIKKEVAAGRPVIVPAAGKLLDNPYFVAPGPVYHMLVIKGYDKTGFITNDPGTRRGESFHYDYDNLYAAIHDWNPTDILKGKKSILVYNSSSN